MVKIRKGSLTLTVPVGAYNAMYAPAGWKLEEGAKNHNSNPAPVEKPKEEEDKVEESVEPAGADEEEYEEIEVDPEELMEKPLEELDFDELVILAEYLGIDTAGVKTAKPLRAAIKKARKDK